MANQAPSRGVERDALIGGASGAPVVARVRRYSAGRAVSAQEIRVLAHWELTPEQWQIPFTVVSASDQALSQNDIAEVTLKDKHAVSRTLDRMVRDGWIVRKPSATDQRAFRIQATARAVRELPEIRATLVAGFDAVLGQMSAPSRKQLRRLVQQLTDIFEQEE